MLALNSQNSLHQNERFTAQSNGIRKYEAWHAGSIWTTVIAASTWNSFGEFDELQFQYHNEKLIL